jgi:hypothetical protein
MLKTCYGDQCVEIWEWAAEFDRAYRVPVSL